MIWRDSSFSRWIRAAAFPAVLTLMAVCIAFSQKPVVEPPPAATPPPQEARREPPPVVALPSFAAVVDKVAPSVVSIHTSRTIKVPRMLRDMFGAPNGGTTQGLGSGVIVSRDGYIMTNNHVTAGADTVYVTIGKDRKEYKAKKIGSDPGTDLAVLKIEGENFPAIPFADSEKIRVGDLVLAVGNPFGLTQTVTMGIVSGLGRGGMGIIDYENFIQTDASVNPGNSGGALVDVEGRLIGINTAIFSRTGGNQGIGFAVPSNLAMQVLNSIREKGRVTRGYLGTVIQPVTKELAVAMKLKSASGALVSDVTPGSPAAKAGIVPGDVIEAVNGKAIDNPRELRLAIGSLMPGTKAKVKFIRDGKEQEIEMVLGELPAAQTQLSPEEARPEATPAAATGVLDGVQLRDLSDEIREGLSIPPSVQGAIIADINPESAAFKAGLRVGHIIVEINRKPVSDARQAERAGGSIKPGEPVLLRVWSAGQSQFLAISPNAD